MTDPRRALKARHWAVALGSALVIHAGVALFLGRPQSSGAVAVGLRGVAVDLGTAGGSPGEVKAAEVAEAASEANWVPEAGMMPPDEIVEPVPPDPSQMVEVAPPVETAAAAAAAEVPLYAPEEPAQAPAQELVETVAAPPAEARPEPVLEAVRAAPAMVTPALPLPKPAPPKAKPAMPAPKVAEAPPADPAPGSAPEPVPEAAAIADAAAAARGPQLGKLNPDDVAGTGGKAGKGTAVATGVEDGRNAGGVPGQSADYKALLMAWLEKHKEYPRRAKLRRQEGTAYLSFVIDRDGQLLEYRLDKSSGYKLLDEEVTAMIERAAPLPPVPDSPPSGRFTYTVPVNFSLR